jgi:deoxyadenosine/deoxycytidine kinase
MSDSAHQYIVVEGPIGVGKTHLVKRLAESLSGSILLEQPEHNPFFRKILSKSQAVCFANTAKFFNAARQTQQNTSAR